MFSRFKQNLPRQEAKKQNYLMRKKIFNDATKMNISVMTKMTSTPPVFASYVNFPNENIRN